MMMTQTKRWDKAAMRVLKASQSQREIRMGPTFHSQSDLDDKQGYTSARSDA